MGKKLLSVFVLLVSAVSVLCLSGCSCLYAGRTYVKNKEEPYEFKGSVYEINLDSIPEGKKIAIYLKNESRIEGEYAGLYRRAHERNSELDEEVIKSHGSDSLMAILVKGELGTRHIAVKDIESVEVKAERLHPVGAFFVGLAADSIFLAAYLLIAVISLESAAY